VVLYGYETWFLTLREKSRFKLSLLRRIFRPKRDELLGGWRKLHDEELHNVYYSLRIITVIKSRRMKWARHIARIRAKRYVKRLFVGMPEGNRPLRRSRCRWLDDIKMDLRERDRERMRWYRVDCSASGWAPVEGSCEHGNELSVSIKFWGIVE
jgi:hypothetical protein